MTSGAPVLTQVLEKNVNDKFREDCSIYGLAISFKNAFLHGRA